MEALLLTHSSYKVGWFNNEVSITLILNYCFNFIKIMSSLYKLTTLAFKGFSKSVQLHLYKLEAIRPYSRMYNGWWASLIQCQKSTSVYKQTKVSIQKFSISGNKTES